MVSTFLIGILLKEELSFLPYLLINSVILLLLVEIHRYLSYSMVFNPILPLFILLLKLFQLWTSGASSGGFCVSLPSYMGEFPLSLHSCHHRLVKTEAYYLGHTGPENGREFMGACLVPKVCCPFLSPLEMTREKTPESGEGEAG